MPTTPSKPGAAKKPVSDGQSFGMPAPGRLRFLKISPEVAWYMVARGYPSPEHPPLVKTPEPRNVKGAVFDPERVDKVIAAFRNLRHTQGELAGKPLTPDPWQVAWIIAPIFGWVRKNDRGVYTRIIRNVYIDVPRKNGKSTMCGGFAIYLTAADGEAGAQVLAAATTMKQAAFVFNPIKSLAQKSPALRGRVRAVHNKIIHSRSDSAFEVVSNVADALHGANVHGAIIDELHLHKRGDLVEAIETGTGSRSQPLVIKITTADEGKPATVYAQNRHYVEQLAKGLFKDETRYGVVFGVPRNADPFDPKTWAQANPGYPISPTHEFLLAESNRAKNSPVSLNAFKRLHLGIRTRQTTEFIRLTDWDRNAGKRITPEDMAGRSCWGGLDLGSVSDLTALAWVFPRDEGSGYDVLWRFWTPEENIEELDKRTAGSASQWVADGWLRTTPGDVTDYDFIEQTILEDAQLFDVQTIGLDRWNGTQLANNLLDQDIPIVKVGQGMITMSPALKEIQRLVLLGKRGDPKLQHGGNPVMRWMIDNLSVAQDAAGNVKPDKATSAEKIDGVSALCDAISEALNTDLQTSAYSDDHDLIIA